MGREGFLNGIPSAMTATRDALAALDDILDDTPTSAPTSRRASAPATRRPGSVRTALDDLDDVLGNTPDDAMPVGNDAPVPGPDPMAPSDATAGLRQSDLFDDLTGGKGKKKSTIHLVDSEKSYGTEAKPLSETVASDGGYAGEPADVSETVADVGPQSKHPRSLTTHPVNGFPAGKATLAADGTLISADYDPDELNKLFGLDGPSDA